MAPYDGYGQPNLLGWTEIKNWQALMALITTYSDGYRAWDDAVERTQQNLGRVFVLVVRERRRNSKDLDFTYGFFFRSLEGVVYDIHKKSIREIKTLFRADAVLDEFVTIYGDQFDSFELPVKSDRNVVEVGGISDSVLPQLAFGSNKGS
jgi:hypothetical protein